MQVEPEAAGLSAERLEHITRHLHQNYIDNGKIAGCQVLVARHGRVAYFRSLGNADRERATPVRDDTIFRIYSMTKPITSVALMTLYEQGYFQLNDPLHRVIPEWRDMRVYVSGEGERMETREPARPITFRHILSHTGGLSYGLSNHPADVLLRALGLRRDASHTLRSFVEGLANVPLRFDPGDRWMYSFSTDVCGYLVEALSGKPFDAYLQETIFDPLGMSDTAFRVAPEKAHRLAANYQRKPDKTLALLDDPATSTYLQEPRFLSGGAGLTSTMADYLRFCEMLRRGGELDGARVLGPRTLELMTKNHLSGGRALSDMAMGAFSETSDDGIGFGLGFQMKLAEVEAGTIGGGDFYWGGAASTIFWVDRDEDMEVIFMTQLMPSATFNFRGQLKSIVYSSIVD